MPTVSHRRGVSGVAAPYRGGSASIAANDYWWYRVRARLLETALDPYVGEAGRVLDVGSADGPSVQWLRGRAVHATLDLDRRGLKRGEGVCGSALALPFASASFDVVGAFDVLEHCQPEATAVREFVRVLRPGGRLLLSVPAYQWAWTDFDEENGHHRRYTRQRAVAALEAGGLEVLRATYTFGSTLPLFALERLARRCMQAFRSGGPVEAADVVSLPTTPRVLDGLLYRLGRLDERILKRHDLPFGSSVVLAARKLG
jgi:SAM-dependent methyltransferase